MGLVSVPFVSRLSVRLADGVNQQNKISLSFILSSMIFKYGDLPEKCTFIYFKKPNEVMQNS